MSSKNNDQNVRSWTGYIFALLAAICAASEGLVIKMSKEEKTQIVLLRCILQYLILLPVMTFKKIDTFGKDMQTVVLLLLRGVCGAIGMMFFATSLDYLSLGDAVAIFYTFPALVGVFACVCLKEKCDVLNVIVTIVITVALVLVAEPTFLFGGSTEQRDISSRLAGIGIALMCASLAACVCIIVRKLGAGVHFTQSIFYYSWEGVAAGFIYLAATGKLVLPCLSSLPLMLMACFFATLNQIFSTISLQRERAGPVSLVKTSQVVFAFLLQFIVLGVVPSLYSAIGASLILLSSVILAVGNIRKARAR